MSLANEFITTLVNKVPDEYLKTIQDAFIIFTNDYDINKKCTDLIPYDYTTPQEMTIYLATCQVEGRSKLTIEGYKLILENFFLKLAKPLKEITSNDILIYLATYKTDRQITDRSLDHIRIVINTFFDWCVDNEYLEKSPSKKIRPIKFRKEKEEALTDFQIESIRSNCKLPRDLAMIDFLLSTGCRVSEILPIKISDIDKQNWKLNIVGKGNKIRTVYITGKAAHSLEKYLESRKFKSDLLFPSEREPHGQLKKEAIEKRFRQIGKLAGVPHLHPHLLRKTMATDALRRGMDITLVQKLLGHESVETTMQYICTIENDVETAHKRFVI